MAVRILGGKFETAADSPVIELSNVQGAIVKGVEVVILSPTGTK